MSKPRWQAASQDVTRWLAILPPEALHWLALAVVARRWAHDRPAVRWQGATR
jgi:hypothetical protein